MQSKLLDKLNRKIGRFSISNLMVYMIAGMVVVFFCDILLSSAEKPSLSGFISFDRDAILGGQVWRFITYAFEYPPSSPLFMLFTLYFYWLIGSALEREWGSFRFNVFYFSSILLTAGVGLITGFATNYFFNMALFFAFAILYPDNEVLLFFVLPIKIKYLAIIDAVYFAYMLIVYPWPGRICLLISIAILVLFFLGDIINSIKRTYRRMMWKRNFR